MTAIDIPTNFKTTLAPRKRAKTQEEKEKRRIERILRNRKAAHASREKKRKHVEFLEKYVIDLEKQLNMYSSLNKLFEKKYQGGDAEIDRLLLKITDLPDLQQVKLDHNIELEEQKDETILPRTPESYTSSPSSQNQEYEMMEAEAKPEQISVSNVSDLTMSKVSPISSPETLDKFSLNFVGLGGHIKQEDNQFFKKEFQTFIPDFNQNVTIKEEILQFPEQLGGDADFNFFHQSEFDELRNPEAPSTSFDLNDFVLLE